MATTARPRMNRYQQRLAILSCLTLSFAGICGHPVSSNDVVRVELKPMVVRNIGGVTRFDRNQFVTIHESPRSRDMTTHDHQLLRHDLDVRYGRDGGLLSSQAARVPADPANAEMPNVRKIRELRPKRFDAHLSRTPSLNDDLRHTVLCTHPELMHAMANNSHTPWGPRTNEAVAEFTAQLLRSYFSNASRPRFVEVFNEPFVKAKQMGTTIDALSEQHNVVARRIRELCPDVLVGGYSAAYVELEHRNFGHFNSWQKRFMDIAGEEMDFFSYHIYDGVNVTGTPRVRTGSNSEAIMDLIDTYSHVRFGIAKPILITEFGNIPEAGMTPVKYDAARTAKMLYSLVGQLMTFMDHPDRLAKVIPFILGKAEWTYSEEAKPGEANVFLLWRRNADGAYVDTDLFLFYRFLLGLHGQWRVSHSSNPDVRAQLLVSEQRLHLMLMNLDDSPKLVKLSGLESMAIPSATLRHLSLDGERPILEERDLVSMPEEVKLEPRAATMLIADLASSPEVIDEVRESRWYSEDHLKEILADSPNHFTFSDVPIGSGKAIIRISTGRPPGLSKLPAAVRLNGTSLDIPQNWAGGPQEGRKNFFGMIEVVAPADLVRPDSVVEVVYPDSGGKVASVVLQLNYEGH